MPTPLAWRKAAPGRPTCEDVSGSPESPARGMLPKGFPVNPGELPTSFPQGRYRPPRETGGDRDGWRAVLRPHTTCEGGEPQGSLELKRARGAATVPTGGKGRTR